MPQMAPSEYHLSHIVCVPQVVPMRYHLSHIVWYHLSAQQSGVNRIIIESLRASKQNACNRANDLEVLLEVQPAPEQLLETALGIIAISDLDPEEEQAKLAQHHEDGGIKECRREGNCVPPKDAD